MARRLRVLFVGRDQRAGGAERVQAALLRHIDRSRFAIKVRYLGADSDLRDEFPQELDLSFGDFGRLPRGIAATRMLARLAREAVRSDLIFAMQEGTPVYMAAAAGALARRPVVAWIHGVWSRLMTQAGYWHGMAARVLYPKTVRLICVSAGVRQDLAVHYPALQDRLSVLPNPLDLERIRGLAEEPPRSWVADLPGGKTLAACGRLVADKGFDLLIEAFASVRRSVKGTKLVLMGDGEDRPRLEGLCRQFGLNGDVVFPGYLANPYPVLRRASVFLSTSRFEGLGMTLLEAMALRVPTVAFDSEGGGPRELLSLKSCGVLVAHNDAGRLAEATIRLLSDGELMERFRDLGEARARDYEAADATRRFEAMFESVCSHAYSLQP